MFERPLPVERLVDRLHGRLVVLPYHVSRHGILRVLLAPHLVARPGSEHRDGFLPVVRGGRHVWRGPAARLKEMPCAVMTRLTPIGARSHRPVASQLCQSAGVE